jgi:hypothetical protein
MVLAWTELNDLPTAIAMLLVLEVLLLLHLLQAVKHTGGNTNQSFRNLGRYKLDDQHAPNMSSPGRSELQGKGGSGD